MRCIFSDVAIGAPYEDDGEGVVYIYRGSLGGLVETPMQVLSSVFTFVFDRRRVQIKRTILMQALHLPLTK